jgi:benzoyl-CoA reductase subunit D
MTDTREHLCAGIDPGASLVKVVITRSREGRGGRTLGRAVQRIRRRDVNEVIRATFEEACAAAGVAPDALDYVATTGDGDGVSFRTGHFYSITTHARGAVELCPAARAVIDVGALHARALRMTAEGRVTAHRMTSQCASGSGQFLENIARYLGVPLEDVGALSTKAARPEKVSSICAVLAETDVINMVARGTPTADILKGIHLSIGGRLVQLVRAVGAEGTVLLTGGLSNDAGLVSAVRELAAEDKPRKGKPVAAITFETHPDAILAGALGASLLGAWRHAQLERRGQRVEPVRYERVRPGARPDDAPTALPER